MSRYEPPAWWPPKVGAALRRSTVHGTHDGGGKRVDARLHVLTVFTGKDGEECVVTAEWFPTKRRWNYEVMQWGAAAVGLIWRDGTKKPE